MESFSRTKPDWTLISVEHGKRPCIQSGMNLIATIPKHSENVPMCLRGLLPTHSYNQTLLEFLNSNTVNVFSDCNVVAGIFAADSFLPFVDMKRALERVGITMVVNFPTVSAYGTVIGRALDDVGIGITCEFETLNRFREHGFGTATVISEAKHLSQVKGEDNFAIIELAKSDAQVF